jgi:hypothetical protein
MTRTQILAISVYMILLLMCVTLLIVSNMLSITVRDTILPIASESFKLVLGALIGAISAVLGVGSNTNRSA